MKSTYFILLALSGLFACNTKEKPDEKIKDYSEKEIVRPNKDSIRFVNSCNNDKFISELYENVTLNSNAYILKIRSKDGFKKVIHRLDLPPGKVHINYCIDDYTVVGFSCGGPCYSQVFVFNNEKRPYEQFGFSQRISNNTRLIAHIENEKFEQLIIHSFDTGKELKLDMRDNDPWNYGHIDSLYQSNNNLILEYTSGDEQSKKKIVNLDKILKP